MQDSKENSVSAKIIFGVIILSIAYAILRYHIVGNVPWKDFPFYILNKGVSLSAFILVSFNFAFGPAKALGIPLPSSWLDARKALGMSGFLLVLIHVFMSLMLFSPAVFGKFFEADGTLTFNAGMSMLFGIFAFVSLWGYNLSFQTFLKEDTAFIAFITSRKVLLVSFWFGAIHLIFMGYKGWMHPEGWNGGLPPISLVAFTVFIIAYMLNLKYRENK